MKRKNLLSILFLTLLTGCGSTTVEPSEHNSIIEDLKNCTNVSIKQTTSIYNDKGEHGSDYYEFKYDDNKYLTSCYSDQDWPDDVIHNSMSKHESIIVYNEESFKEAKNNPMYYAECEIYTKDFEENSWSKSPARKKYFSSYDLIVYHVETIDFDKLVYNEDRKEYVYSENEHFEMSIKYKNKKLEELSIKHLKNSQISMSINYEYFDYGSTSIKIPKI